MPHRSHQIGSRTVAVLGLGRLGTAIADRLDPAFDVRRWNRTRPPADDLLPERASDAVTDAKVVVLVLFDAAACVDVLKECVDVMPPGGTVINMSTVSPEQAVDIARLVTDHDRDYLHAPVMGSGPAARDGQLTILAGGSPTTPVAEVLDRLGTTVDAHTSQGAAAMKLLANGVLGDAVLSLRRSLQRGAALGLSRTEALTVLERTLLSRLVAGKRPFLTDPPEAGLGSDFAVSALIKDLRLLGSTSAAEPGAVTAFEILLETAGVTGADDITRLAAHVQDRTWLRDARLEISPETEAGDGVLEPLHLYALGHATGDQAHFRRAFLPTAHVEGYRDGAFVSWDLDEYCSRFDGRPASDEASRSRRVDQVTVRGAVATATMTLLHGLDTFTDMFVLIEDGTGWRIANKVYRRTTAG